MKKSFSLLCLLFFTAGGLVSCKIVPPSKVNRESLYKGLTIPEKREYPLSKTVKACEDFHQYICGPVEASFTLPKDRNYWVFSFVDNSEKLLQAKKNFFQLIGNGFRPSGERIPQVTDYYLACMDQDASKKDETKAVREEIETLEKVKNLKDLQKLSKERIFSPYLSFSGFDSTADQDRPEEFDLLVYGRVMSLPERSFYENKELVADFTRVLELFFENIKVDHPKERASKVVAFEKKMAQAWPLPSEIRDRYNSNTYKPREWFLKQYPEMGFDEMFTRFPKALRIRDLTPEALKFLDGQLASGDLETLKSVFLFRDLKSVLDSAYPKFRQAWVDFTHKHLGGPQERPPLQERCTTKAMDSFSFEVDEYLIPILFPDFPREKVVELVKKVRDAHIEKIKNNLWLSEGAKSEAQRKLETAKLFLVEPQTPEEWDFNPIEKYDSKTPVQNERKLEQAQIEKSLKELQGKRPRSRWGMAPLVLNAYYDGSDNDFFLMQGILQPPFFQADADPIENLGGIGAVIGHELGHAIDDKGSMYNSKGEFKQWMTKKDLQEFKRRTEVLVKRFDAIGHNGKFTLGENIGDHEGLGAAYLAAFPADKGSKEEKQKFFAAYARLWCAVVDPKYEKTLLKIDPHAASWARINEQVVQLQGFYEAYDCKAGDKMYVAPKERISLW